MRIVRSMLFLGLAAILAAQFWSLRLPSSLDLPPQQTVETNNPKIGIHTRLTGIADEAYIQQSLEQVREMGASWIVDLFPWTYTQPRSRYGFDWNGSDMVIQHAQRQGLTIVARIDQVPPWARPSNTSGSYLEPEYYVDYANYVVAFLERYRPYGVRHVIIWNEPNLTIEWGQRSPDPVAYTELLKVVYPLVKAAVPDAIIIAGALSPGPDLGDNAEVRLNDLEYMTAMYESGAADYFDMWAVHPYGYILPHDNPPDPDVVNFRRTEVQRDIMIDFGDEEKPLIITEGGWNDNARWHAAVRPSQRLRWTVSAYEMAQEWDWMEAVCLWQFALPEPTYTYHDNWNFVAPDGTPKAIYWAVQEAASR